MPIHLPALSRRRFLAGTAAAAAGFTILPAAWAAEERDPNFLALLSDTHVPSTPDITARGVNMTENLKRVAGEVAALNQPPSAVIINGDCAYLKGLPEDYANFGACLAPLDSAGLPVHLTMGNHDNRGSLYGALAKQRPADPPLESKHVSVLETPHANWFLLDSLFETNVVTGELGAAQRGWLAKALDSRRNKPAIVIAHHTPQFEPPPEGKAWGGIRDTAEFFELLSARRHVKAFVFGHSHDWKVSRQGGLHLVNLPPVAYVFGDGKPNGWVAAHVQRGGMRLTLHTLDPQHAQSGEQVELMWS